MSVTECKYHTDHENRITRLEHDMEEIKKDNKKQNITVATISLIGVIITAMSSFAGVVFTAFMKSKGVF